MPLIRPPFGLLLLIQTVGLSAESSQASLDAGLDTRLAQLQEQDAALVPARDDSLDCETGCILPSEAIRLAFEAGEGEARAGRFLLDVKGGGQSLSGALGQLFFVSSRQDYARFGTLTVAIEPDALYNILRRARVCPGSFGPRGIEVRGCRQDVNFKLDMFTMIRRLGGKRIAVDGEAMLQWIDARTGLPKPAANKRGEHEAGYYQVWVRVDDADQVIFVYDE